MYRVRQRLVPVAALVVLLGACGGSGDRSPEVVSAAGARDQARISGAGSTLVAPIVRDWIAQYQRVAPGVAIEYRPVGSGRGMRDLASRAVDFAASELPLTEAEEQGMEDGALLRVPWVASGVAVGYNLPTVGGLRLSAGTLAGVLTGRIVAWNDPLIQAENAGVSLPSVPISVVYRSDPSGTTQALTGFLKGAAPGVWTLGSGPTVRWPRGTAVEGSDAVIAAVRQRIGSVGYVDYAHAREGGVGIASVRNGAGAFVVPDAEAVNAAISGASPESPGAYPIAMVSYVAFTPTPGDPSKRAALGHFVEWVLTEGQRSAEPRSFTRLPHALLVTALADLKDAEYGGAPIDRRPR